jgi:hypothetical protein
MTWLVVKNWATHQHYKDRMPPWIKLHMALLDDYEFSRLRDASKAHLTLIWLLASRENGRVRADAEWIARRIGASDPVDLQVLVDAGFLVPEEDASTVPASCPQVAPREEERREETTSTSSGAVVAVLIAKVAKHPRRWELARRFDDMPDGQNPNDWAGLIIGLLEGVPPRDQTGQVCPVALDHVLDGWAAYTLKLKGDPAPALFQSCVRSEAVRSGQRMGATGNHKRPGKPSTDDRVAKIMSIDLGAA